MAKTKAGGSTKTDAIPQEDVLDKNLVMDNSLQQEQLSFVKEEPKFFLVSMLEEVMTTLYSLIEGFVKYETRKRKYASVYSEK